MKKNLQFYRVAHNKNVRVNREFSAWLWELEEGPATKIPAMPKHLLQNLMTTQRTLGMAHQRTLGETNTLKRLENYKKAYLNYHRSILQESGITGSTTEGASGSREHDAGSDVVKLRKELNFLRAQLVKWTASSKEATRPRDEGIEQLRAIREATSK